MSPLKKAIFVEVRKSEEVLQPLNDEELNRYLFHHPDGLRLSQAGYKIIKRLFTAYSFEIPPTIKTKHRFGMSKMEYPYYFTSGRLILFSSMDAMVVKIHGGIQSFLETCSQYT